MDVLDRAHQFLNEEMPTKPMVGQAFPLIGKGLVTRCKRQVERMGGKFNWTDKPMYQSGMYSQLYNTEVYFQNAVDLNQFRHWLMKYTRRVRNPFGSKPAYQPKRASLI